MTEKEQFDLIRHNPYHVAYMDDPSEELILSAIEREARVIKYIKNPSEKVQLAAVRCHIYMIHLIKNPTEKVQMLAINTDPRLIEEIRTPTKKVKMAAVRSNVWMLRRIGIENQDEEVQMYAVKRVISLIRDGYYEHDDFEHFVEECVINPTKSVMKEIFKYKVSKNIS